MPILIAILMLISTAAAAQQQPYAGQERRALKALSADEVRDLTEGAGMGLAKAAELNGFPGPRHVLDLAEAGSLKLTPGQLGELRAIFAAMNTAAKRIGASILTAETELDQRFANHQIDGQTITGLTARISRMQGELRAVHLRAHVATAAALTPDLIAAYNKLRGYGEAADAAGQHRH